MDFFLNLLVYVYLFFSFILYLFIVYFILHGFIFSFNADLLFLEIPWNICLARRVFKASTFRREYKPFGIRCSILEPGSFRTGLISHDFVKKSVEGTWSKLSHEVKEEYGEQYKENSELSFLLNSYAEFRFVEWMNSDQGWALFMLGIYATLSKKFEHLLVIFG